MGEILEMPIVVGQCLPFRLVVRPEDVWEVTIDEINTRSYDYVKLNRLSTFVDIGIAPFSLGVGFDGSLVLPMTLEYRNREVALALFNKLLCQLLLGGVYTEAVLPEDVTTGSLKTNGYYRMGISAGAINNFHASIRTKASGPFDNIKLLEPEEISTEKFQTAISKGRKITNQIPELSPTIFLNGVTSFVKHRWAESILSLWAATEQIIEHIWNETILAGLSDETEISGRRDFLQDHRSWPVSTKIELIYQLGRIRNTEYSLLSRARKARNDFMHKATIPDKAGNVSSLTAFLNLISLASSEYQEAGLLEDTRQIIQARMRRDPFEEKTLKPQQVKFWREIPPIPGDESWGDQEYEQIEDITLKPLEESRDSTSTKTEI